MCKCPLGIITRQKVGAARFPLIRLCVIKQHNEPEYDYALTDGVQRRRRRRMTSRWRRRRRRVMRRMHCNISRADDLETV